MATTDILNQGHGALEYLLCIEGVGWPGDEFSLSNDFQGDIFTTADLNGDLSTLLGSDGTARAGLQTPSSVSDELDPRTAEYTVESMEFDIVDHADVLQGAITPHLTTIGAGTVSGSLAITETSLDIDETDQAFADDDVAWIAGREAVKLSSRALVGGNIYRYTVSRGYLGTPKGRFDGFPTNAAFAWRAGVEVYTANKYWYDRRVKLYAHAPGEAMSAMLLLYTGRIRGVPVSMDGKAWKIKTVAEKFPGQSRYRVASTATRADTTVVLHQPSGYVYNWNFALNKVIHATIVPAGMPGVPTNGAVDSSQFLYHYHYRMTSGGTMGVPSAGVTTPQAWQDADEDRRVIALAVRIGDEIVRALWTVDGALFYDWVLEPWSLLTGDWIDLDPFKRHANWAKAEHNIRFLLDNTLDDAKRSRFAVDNRVRRHPVDVALMFLTTMPHEFFVGDATTGGTTTVVPFTAPGFVADEWIGYAVFCVEQDADNHGEAREISDNDTTDLTVDRAFSNAPTNAHEYQIRNSIYDTLPLGWGLGVRNEAIDIAEYERIREVYLAGAELGRFIIGEEDRIDLWEMLTENIFKPFRIINRIDRTTGKLKPAFVGEAMGDGIAETYVDIAEDEIFEISEIETVPYAPTREILLQLRADGSLPVTDYTYKNGMAGIARDRTNFAGNFAAAQFRRSILSVAVRSEEIDGVFPTTDLERLQVGCQFNDAQSSDWLIAHYMAVQKRIANPPPRFRAVIHPKHLATVQAGTFVTLTSNTEGRLNPWNPYTGSRGMNQQAARTTSSRWDFRRHVLVIEVELLREKIGARYAPALLVESKGNDAGGDYFDCTKQQFVNDEANNDSQGLVAGDLIDLRNKDGTVVEAETVDSIDTSGATIKVYVVGTIAATIASGDYITFSAWDTTATSNMEKHAAYGDSNKTLGSGNDAARDYA